MTTKRSKKHVWFIRYHRSTTVLTNSGADTGIQILVSTVTAATIKGAIELVEFGQKGIRIVSATQRPDLKGPDEDEDPVFGCRDATNDKRGGSQDDH